MKIQNNNNRVNFKSREFRINDIDGLPCAYCGRKMISRKSIEHLFDNCEENGELFLDKARENAEYMKPFQQDIINYLTRIHCENSFIDDESILKKAKSDSSIEMRKDLSDKFIQLIHLIENSGRKDLKVKLRTGMLDFNEYLFRKRRYEAFEDIIYSGKFLGIKKKNNDEFTQKIEEILDDSCKADYSPFSYVLDNYRTHSAKDFYKEFFMPSESTIEHLVPKSKDGKNETKNYLAVCRKCNSDRSSIDFPIFLQTHPKTKANIVAQIRELKEIIPELIKNNKITPEYRLYPDKVKKTIKRISNGEIDFKA